MNHPAPIPVYSKQIIVSPSMCGASPALSHAAVFTLFQDLAAEHAERIGVGGAAMAARGLFWLTAHTRVEFFKRAYMTQELTVTTWPAPYEPSACRCYRYYTLTHGADCIAHGKTMWAVSDTQKGGIRKIADAGFPDGFPFRTETVCPQPLHRFTDSLTAQDGVFTHTIRASDVDFGGHMNNVAYVRTVLDAFPAKELTQMDVSALEIRYAHPCYEGQTLTVRRRETDGGWALAVCDGAEKAAAFARLELGGAAGLPSAQR